MMTTIAEEEKLVLKWMEERRLSNPLTSRAMSAVLQVDEFNNTGRIIPAFAALYLTYIAAYREIDADIQRLNDAARLTEIALWFGRPDKATYFEVKRSDEFNNTWRPGADFGLAVGEGAIKTYWDAATVRGHSFRKDGFEALLWGSAGRALITMKHEAIPDAEITLIMDDGSAHPRGGIQSLDGTLDELLNLLWLSRQAKIEFQPEDGVTWG